MTCGPGSLQPNLHLTLRARAGVTGHGGRDAAPALAGRHRPGPQHLQQAGGGPGRPHRRHLEARRRVHVLVHHPAAAARPAAALAVRAAHPERPCLPRGVRGALLGVPEIERQPAGGLLQGRTDVCEDKQGGECLASRVCVFWARCRCASLGAMRGGEAQPELRRLCPGRAHVTARLERPSARAAAMALRRLTRRPRAVPPGCRSCGARPAGARATRTPTAT